MACEIALDASRGPAVLVAYYGYQRPLLIHTSNIHGFELCLSKAMLVRRPLLLPA